jgi:hypothetical protein
MVGAGMGISTVPEWSSKRIHRDVHIQVTKPLQLAP